MPATGRAALAASSPAGLATAASATRSMTPPRMSTSAGPPSPQGHPPRARRSPAWGRRREPRWPHDGAGHLHVGSGEINVPEDPGRSTVHASVGAASFASGNPRRDRDVTSRRFLNAAEYPELTFDSTKVNLEGPGRWTLAGVMTAHGSAQEVRFAVADFAQVNGGYRVLARARIDRTSFGVTVAKGFISRFVNVEVEIIAIR